MIVEVLKKVCKIVRFVFVKSKDYMYKKYYNILIKVKKKIKK